MIGVIVAVGQQVEPVEHGHVLGPGIGQVVPLHPLALEPVVEQPRPVGLGVGGAAVVVAPTTVST